MFPNPWTVLTGIATIAHAQLRKLYKILLKVSIVLACIILIEWMCNATGYKELNYIFFFLGGWLYVAFAFSPIALEAGAAAGTVIAALKDTDLTQGAYAGVLKYCKTALSVLLSFWMISGLLATWSFAENPGAFFPFAAMVAVLATASVVFGSKSGGVVLKAIITTYATVVIVMALYSTLTVQTKDSYFSWIPGHEKVSDRMIPGELVLLRAGEKSPVTHNGFQCFTPANFPAGVRYTQMTTPNATYYETDQTVSLAVWRFNRLQHKSCAESAKILVQFFQRM